MGKHVILTLEYDLGDYSEIIEENGGRIIQDPKYWEEVFFQSDAVICDMDITSVKIIEK